MQPFLNCNIWSVNITEAHGEFYYVEKVYHYNSLESGMLYFSTSSVQIPEFQIKNIHLLNTLSDSDYENINKYYIPILRNQLLLWEIDLTHYENFKLQSSNL